MFVGQCAADRTKGGRQALNEAQAADAQGKLPDWIHQRHGWFKAEDGQWRHEVSDKDMALTGKLKKGGPAVPLDHAIKHDEMFRVDPNLRDVTVEARDIPGFEGGYDKDNRRIYVKDPKDLKTIAHEKQHDIQYRHGLTPGTTIEREGGDAKAYHNNLGERESRDVEKGLSNPSRKPDLLRTAGRGAG